MLKYFKSILSVVKWRLINYFSGDNNKYPYNLERNLQIAAFLLFCSLYSTSQVDSVKLTPREITEANGNVSVESQYPVDTILFEFSYLYLDSELQIAKEKNFLDHKYRILQNTIYGYEIAKLPRRKPSRVQLDSVIVDTVVNSFFKSNKPKTYTSIISGHLIYEKFGKSLDYKIENGKVFRITVSDKKSSRVLYYQDFSKLYSEEDRSWPFAVGYRKDGTVRGRDTMLYHERYYYIISWRNK